MLGLGVYFDITEKGYICEILIRTSVSVTRKVWRCSNPFSGLRFLDYFHIHCFYLLLLIVTHFSFQRPDILAACKLTSDSNRGRSHKN